jgi:hypothetical protein
MEDKATKPQRGEETPFAQLRPVAYSGLEAVTI